MPSLVRGAVRQSARRPFRSPGTFALKCSWLKCSFQAGPPEAERAWARSCPCRCSDPCRARARARARPAPGPTSGPFRPALRRAAHKMKSGQKVKGRTPEPATAPCRTVRTTPPAELRRRSPSPRNTPRRRAPRANARPRPRISASARPSPVPAQPAAGGSVRHSGSCGPKATPGFGPRPPAP